MGDGTVKMKRISLCGICGTSRLVGAECRPCSNRRNKEYKIRNAKIVKAARSVYKKRKHAEKANVRAEKKAPRDITRPGRRKLAKSKWKVNNKGIVNANTAWRHACKVRAIPKWANRFFIEEAYRLARLRTDMFGFEWHVDHIIPLRSQIVCGLHVETNLRVIPAVENMRKGNRLLTEATL